MILRSIRTRDLTINTLLQKWQSLARGLHGEKYRKLDRELQALAPKAGKPETKTPPRLSRAELQMLGGIELSCRGHSRCRRRHCPGAQLVRVDWRCRRPRSCW